MQHELSASAQNLRLPCSLKAEWTNDDETGSSKGARQPDANLCSIVAQRNR